MLKCAVTCALFLITLSNAAKIQSKETLIHCIFLALHIALLLYFSSFMYSTTVVCYGTVIVAFLHFLSFTYSTTVVHYGTVIKSRTGLSPCSEFHSFQAQY